jgi:PAS domain S-box-containing protein
VTYVIAHIGDGAGDRLVRSAAAVAPESLEFVPPERHSFDADVFVVGPGAEGPLRLAQDLRRRAPAAQIMFLTPPDRLERFRASLPFVPHLASAWTADAESAPEALAYLLVKAARAGAQRATADLLRSRINLQLGRTARPNTDVDEQRQRQLSLSEGYVATLLSQAPDGFVAITPEGMVAAWNHAAEALLGIPAAAAIGQSVASVLPEALHRRLIEVIATGVATPAMQREDMALEFSGGVRWLEVSFAPVWDEAGELATMSVSLRDVTERRGAERKLQESEARFRTLTETLPQLVWTCSPGGRCEYLSRQWVEYTGLPEANQLGLAWLDRVIHPDDRERTLEHWLGAVAGDHPYDLDFRIRGADGTFRWFKTRGTPIQADDGHIIQWFGTCTDIEEIVRARESLARSAEELEQRVADEMARRAVAEEALRQAQKMEAVGQLTGGIAHDFNNLLQGITGSLDLLQRRVRQGRVSEIERFIAGAMTSAGRASALTHRLLAFARRQPLDPRPVRANPLVTSMEDLLRRTLGETVSLELVLAGGLWLTLCDPNQLESSILNLAINARDAMPDGGQLTIETCNTHIDAVYAANHADVRPGQYVCVCVTDTGYGMSADTISKAFEPFFTTKPIGQGTGLGLSMIYGFARQSEGFAKIYSEVGKGTTVKLYLPRFRGEIEGDEVAALGSDLPKAEAGETVLVVEDEPVVRSLIVDVLQELGYAALEAHDGPSGLKILQSRIRIDLLITDIGLPGLNGRQIADAARQRRPELKVLFMTGYAENAALASGILEPGMAMVTKPFAMDDLAARIRRTIEER